MFPSSTLNTQLPEWYTLERKAEKSIKRLSTIKELDYYIKHPDEQLRRLAILRINELKLKDSFTILKEVLDEPMETQANKELAAWTLKYISVKLGKDLFISHRLLTRYTGNETYNELYNVIADKNLPAPKLSFSDMPAEYKVKLKSSEILNAQISLPDMEFDFKSWLSNFSKNALSNIRTGVKSFFSDFSGNMKKAITGIPLLFKNTFKKRPKTIKASVTCPAGKYAMIGISETDTAATVQQAAAGLAAAPAPQQAAYTVAASAPVNAPQAVQPAQIHTLQASAANTAQIPILQAAAANPVQIPTLQAAAANTAKQHKPEVYSTKPLSRDTAPQSFRIIPFKEDKSSSSYHSYYEEKKKAKAPGLKKILFEILYILLAPVRFIIKIFKGIYRNKLKIIAALAAIYCFLVFTTFGRAVFLRYTGVDLRAFHMQTVENIKSAVSIATAEIKALTRLDTGNTAKPSKQSENKTSGAASTGKTYVVTAKSGLNVRTEPSSSAPKAGEILENGSRVTYLNKSSKDSGGRVWYYIKTSEGISGWVYSGGLK